MLAAAVSAAGEARASEVANEAKVRLLFPILTGSELDKLLPLAPQGVLVQLEGGNFVEVGRFSDARVAHRVGVSIQRRIAIPFDLAYDQGHPQLELALKGQLLPGIPPLLAGVAPGPSPRVNPSGSPSGQFELANVLAEPPGSSGQPADGSQGDVLQPSPPIAEPAQRRPVDQRSDQDTAAIAQTAKAAGLDQVLQRVFTPLPLEPELVEEVAPAGPDARPQAVPSMATSRVHHADTAASAASDEPADLSEVLRQALNPIPLAAAPGESPGQSASRDSSEPASSPLVRNTHPWLRPVSIAAVDLGVPITRLEPALNASLNYLYVQIRQPGDVARLQRMMPVQELAVQGDVVLARVGVFTASRQGQVLLAERLARLRAERLEPRLARAGGGGWDLQA